jgi:hypothetical protein
VDARVDATRAARFEGTAAVQGVADAVVFAGLEAGPEHTAQDEDREGQRSARPEPAHR